MAENKQSLTVVVTAHAEGLLAHRTLASVARAVEAAQEAGFKVDVMVSGDRLDDDTRSYLKRSAFDFTLVEHDSGDLALSRNLLVTKAKGDFIAFIDADDLMSRGWLRESMIQLTNLKDPTSTIAHSETTLVFGTNTDPVLIKKHPSLTIEDDALLSVFSNRWNSIIVAHKSILKAFPYEPNRDGHGYEDWLFNAQTRAAGHAHILIPKTAIFVRRKESGSLLQGQLENKAVLRANNLLAFSHIRKLAMPASWELNDLTAPVSSESRATATIKRTLKSSPQLALVARKTYRGAKKLRSKMQFFGSGAVLKAESKARPISGWLRREWGDIATIEKQLFPGNRELQALQHYDSLSLAHRQAGIAYKLMVEATNSDNYDYLLFAPWLIRGGGDLVTIRYANTLTKLKPGLRVAVIGTEDNPSSWQERLAEGVDFINFGSITRNLGDYEREKAMEAFVENSGAKTFHIINSRFGYQFVRERAKYFSAGGRQVVVTSFSQSVDADGRVYGYSHTHAPQMYQLAKLYTSDNAVVKQMWEQEYGFAPEKSVVHYQPVTIPSKIWRPRQGATEFKVLWASRLSPEKQPHLLPEIGRLLSDLPIKIEMYGEGDAGFDLTKFRASLPKNVAYIRPYYGFDDLPYQECDAFLYTSAFDGMPNIVLEAGAAGLPLVTAAVGGVPSLVNDHSNGLLVNELNSAQAYAEALRELYGEVELRQQLAAELHKTVKERHSEAGYERQIRELIKLLKI